MVLARADLRRALMQLVRLGLLALARVALSVVIPVPARRVVALVRVQAVERHRAHLLQQALTLPLLKAIPDQRPVARAVAVVLVLVRVVGRRVPVAGTVLALALVVERRAPVVVAVL